MTRRHPSDLTAVAPPRGSAGDAERPARPSGSLGNLVDLLDRRRMAKALSILRDDTHPQFELLRDIVDTAIALDPAPGFVESDPASPWGIRRPDPGLIG